MNISLKGTLSSFGEYKVINSYNNPLGQISPGMTWFDKNNKPAIYIFDESLDKYELQYVLAHEAAHIINGDLANKRIDFHKLKALGHEEYLASIITDPEYLVYMEEHKEENLKIELTADKTAYEVFGYDKIVACEFLEYLSMENIGFMHEHIQARIDAIGGF